MTFALLVEYRHNGRDGTNHIPGFESEAAAIAYFEEHLDERKRSGNQSITGDYLVVPE